MSISEFDTLEFHEKLGHFYSNWYSDIVNVDRIPHSPSDIEVHQKMENAWNAHEERKAMEYGLPTSSAHFEEWWRALGKMHEEAVKPFFNFIEREATLEQIAYFVCLDDKVDGHFDDLIAYAQIGLKGPMRMVIAENYWDEMGRGDPSKIHTAMFSVSTEKMLSILGRNDVNLDGQIPVEAYKNGNILQMYAARRHWVGRLYGALSILEFTASPRFLATANGLRRLDIESRYIEYFQSHVSFDEDHGEDLLIDLLMPAAKQSPAFMREAATGAVIRYQIAAGYYDKLYEIIRTLK